MSRYYFDLHDGAGVAADETGLDLPNLRAVQLEAAHSLADMVRNAGDDVTGEMSIEVRDAAGPVLQAKVTFAPSQKTH